MVGMMKIFNKDKYSGLLVQGNLHDAIEYIEQFSDQAELINKYKEVFIQNKELTRTDNKVINELDTIYQRYYKDVFWYKQNIKEAENKLFKNLRT